MGRQNQLGLVRIVAPDPNEGIMTSARRPARVERDLRVQALPRPQNRARWRGAQPPRADLGEGIRRGFGQDRPRRKALLEHELPRHRRRDDHSGSQGVLDRGRKMGQRGFRDHPGTRRKVGKEPVVGVEPVQDPRESCHDRMIPEDGAVLEFEVSELEANTPRKPHVIAMRGDLVLNDSAGGHVRLELGRVDGDRVVVIGVLVTHRDDQVVAEEVGRIDLIGMDHLHRHAEARLQQRTQVEAPRVRVLDDEDWELGARAVYGRHHGSVGQLLRACAVRVDRVRVRGRCGFRRYVGARTPDGELHHEIAGSRIRDGEGLGRDLPRSEVGGECQRRCADVGWSNTASREDAEELLAAWKVARNLQGTGERPDPAGRERDRYRTALCGGEVEGIAAHREGGIVGRHSEHMQDARSQIGDHERIRTRRSGHDRSEIEIETRNVHHGRAADVDVRRYGNLRVRRIVARDADRSIVRALPKSPGIQSHREVDAAPGRDRAGVRRHRHPPDPRDRGVAGIREPVGGPRAVPDHPRDVHAAVLVLQVREGNGESNRLGS